MKWRLQSLVWWSWGRKARGEEWGGRVAVVLVAVLLLRLGFAWSTSCSTLSRGWRLQVIRRIRSCLRRAAACLARLRLWRRRRTLVGCRWCVLLVLLWSCCVVGCLWCARVFLSRTRSSKASSAEAKGLESRNSDGVDRCRFGFKGTKNFW